MTIGDFFAALVGKAIGTIKLYGKKTIQGFLACFISCWVLGYNDFNICVDNVRMMVFLHMRIPVQYSLILASSGALAAAVSELFAIFDDNLVKVFYCLLLTSCSPFLYSVAQFLHSLHI